MTRELSEGDIWVQGRHFLPTARTVKMEWTVKTWSSLHRVTREKASPPDLLTQRLDLRFLQVPSALMFHMP